MMFHSVTATAISYRVILQIMGGEMAQVLPVTRQFRLVTYVCHCSVADSIIAAFGIPPSRVSDEHKALEGHKSS